MSLDTAQVVETLDDLELLDLDEDGPWEPGDDLTEFDPYEIAWDEVLAPLDEETVDIGDWDAVIGAMDSQSSGGPHLPPPHVFDALAWYLPIHFYGPGWGIWIREDVVIELAASLRSRLPLQRRYDLDVVWGCIRAALGVLFLHEAFHHKLESFAIRLEIVEHRKRYAPYTDRVFTPIAQTHPTDLFEESLACADAYRRPRSEQPYSRGLPPDVRSERYEWLKDWFPTLPPGYDQANLYLTSEYEPALNHLASQVHEAVEHPMRRPEEWDLAPQSVRGLFDCQRVARVLVPIGTRPFVPWFNRAPRPLSISTTKLASSLQQDGYTLLKGGKGSHLKLKAPGRPMIILPANREALSPNVLSTVAEALGLSSLHQLEPWLA